MIMLLLAVPLALANPDECRWPTPPTDVYASMTRVYVDSERVPVRGRRARERFAGDLRACGWHDAASRADDWRRSRRSTNAWAAAGVLIFWPGLIVAGVTASKAGQRKGEMVEAILAGR